jgi:hypothetical protein
VKWYGKYGRKVSWKVKWYEKYGRKPSWIVKRYGKYGRKPSWIVKRYVIPWDTELLPLTVGHNVNLNKLHAVLIVLLKKKLSSIFSIFLISFHNFLLYFPNLFTIRLAFLPYFPSYNSMCMDNIKVGGITLYVEV